MSKDKLSDRHRQFCDEYLSNGMNATQAYLSVYKSVKKEETARVNGSKLLTNTNIKKYIADKQANLSKKFEVTREKLGKMLLDRAELVNKMQELAKKDKLTSTEESQYARLLMLLKASDGNKAIDLLGKMFGLNEPSLHEHKHEGINFNILKPGDKEENE